jgi:hypothetical protein
MVACVVGLIVIADTPEFFSRVVCGATEPVPGEDPPDDEAGEEEPPPPIKNIAAIATTTTTPITAAMGSHGWSKEAFLLFLMSVLQNIC